MYYYLVNRKNFDLTIVVMLFIIAAIFSLIFNLKPLMVAILTLLIPSLYLLCRKKENLLKIVIAVIVFGGMFGFFFDFIVTYNKGWIVSDLVIPYRLFGFYPIFDDILGFMLMTLFIIVFYEHFLDDYKLSTVSPNIWKAITPALIISVLMLILYIIEPNLLKIPYIYLVTGLLAIIKLVSVGVSKKKFLIKFLYISIFFFFVWFTLELICLANGGWYFPGQYVGEVTMGNLMFPLEELIFWFMLYSATIVAFYEYYEDSLSVTGR